MAINPSAAYAGSIDTSDPTNYPYGRPQNDNTPATDGTPLDQAWLSDLFGFQQALLEAANITPSGTPDSATVSQYLEALLQLRGRKVFTSPGPDVFSTFEWVKRLKVTITAGGGSGGWTTSSGGGGGGGAGSTRIVYIDNPDAMYSLTVGAGGAAPLDGGNGNTGQASTFGAFTTNPGGAGLVSGDFGDGGGGSAGSTANNLHFGGSCGTGPSQGRAGSGGASYWGGGTRGPVFEAGSTAARAFGAGGPGANGSDGTAVGGGSGIIIVEWGIGI